MSRREDRGIAVRLVQQVDSVARNGNGKVGIAGVGWRAEWDLEVSRAMGVPPVTIYRWFFHEPLQ